MSLPAKALADTYYSLEFEEAQLDDKNLLEDGRSFRLRTEGGSSAPQIVFDRARQSYVLKLSTSATPALASNDRAEITIYSGVDFGRELFLGFQVFIPGRIAFSDTWHLLMQCHQAGTQRSPPVSLNLSPDGELVLVSRNDADTYEPLWTGKIPKDRWFQVVLGLRMGERGRLQLWQDGVRVADKRLALGWAQGEDRCVMKTGLYRGPARTPFEIRLDNVLLGSTYRGALPR